MNHTHRHGTPTQILKSEHEVILGVLSSLETMLDRIESGTAPDREFFGKTVEFFQGFADRCHHGKEEQHLFPAMAQAGVPEHGGPVGVMLQEHDQGRSHIQGIVAAVENLATRPEEGKTGILEHGRAYVEMLRGHIQKENEILFPMADRVIGAGNMQELARAFERVEAEMGEDAHERFLNLAGEIHELAKAQAPSV